MKEVSIRETREGWPSAHSLELRQMGTEGVHMKGVLPWSVRWAPRAGIRDFGPALAALVGPVQNIFSTPDSFLLCLSGVPIAQLAGQDVVSRRLSLSKCL